MQGKAHTARVTLYRNKGKIHARSTRGRFNSLRWAMVWLTQLVFYGACWLGWTDDGGATRQALLFDIAHEKFYLFGLVLWPQDALLLAIVLILAATGLFLVTAVAGRLFCGFACPQTVYTSIFMWIEEKVEGDHLARRRLDDAPWTARKLALRSAKHGLWLALAAWTGITFVGYFTPIRELLPAVAGWQLGPWEGFWVVFYGLFMYLQAGFAREAVCQHMCPYSRFQGVMFDPTTRSVAYDTSRGEPRRAKGGAGAGDCVDCGICVQVCPTGIDIRRGLQYECIGCAACIDGCNQVMEKMGYPKGLIRYTTENVVKGKYPDSGILGHVFRPRVLVYGAILLAVISAFLITLANRVPLRLEVIRDRLTLSRTTDEGLLENLYTLQILNMENQRHRYKISVSGADDIRIVVDDNNLQAGPQETVQVPIRLQVDPASLKGPSTPILIKVQAEENPRLTREAKSSFLRR